MSRILLLLLLPICLLTCKSKNSEFYTIVNKDESKLDFIEDDYLLFGFENTIGCEFIRFHVIFSKLQGMFLAKNCSGNVEVQYVKFLDKNMSLFSARMQGNKQFSYVTLKKILEEKDWMYLKSNFTNPIEDFLEIPHSSSYEVTHNFGEKITNVYQDSIPSSYMYFIEEISSLALFDLEDNLFLDCIDNNQYF